MTLVLTQKLAGRYFNERVNRPQFHGFFDCNSLDRKTAITMSEWLFSRSNWKHHSQSCEIDSCGFVVMNLSISKVLFPSLVTVWLSVSLTISMTIWKMIRVRWNRCKPENNDIINEVSLVISILLRKYIRKKFHWQNLLFLKLFKNLIITSQTQLFYYLTRLKKKYSSLRKYF